MFKNIIDFVKKNKVRFFGLVLLDILFFTLFVFIVSGYMPQINDKIEVFDGILADSGADESITQLSQHAPQILLLHSQMEKIVFKMVLWILLVANLIYAIFFSTVLRIKSRYVLSFIGVNVILQFILWMIFSVVVEIKGAVMGQGILSQSSRASMFIFMIIAHIIYFFGLIFIVEMRKKKAFAKSWEMIKKKGLGLFGKYVGAIVLFWIVLILTQMPLFMNLNAIILIMLVAIGFLILMTYMSLAKVYMIQEIVKAEK